MSNSQEKRIDVAGVCGTPSWAYNDTVKDHFFNPRNLLKDHEDFDAGGTGTVGSPACGDVMLVAISVDAKTKRITGCRWRTFGCASAIASTSMMSIMVTENGGMTLARARRLKPEEIIDRLGGLPDRKYHCSVLGHEALREAVEDYLNHELS
ncbi:MAG TPA: iron-sulfur cluster assembly scaffold protein [Candidatus Kaiserbacteria bacterium]|nr:iron-sulfur cluster assembly scaffold protein [Candidatus Kaiserbacteria bacterium]